MMKEYSKFKNIILPNKKLNYFVFSIISVGFITGCIFLVLISKTDKDLVVNSIKNFINIDNYNSLDILKNVSVINFIYIIFLIIFSLSVIGSILNVLIIYFKSFILGFSISSLFMTYSIKSLPIVLNYLIFSELINLFIIYILGIYSLLFSYKVIGQVFYKRDNYIKRFIKKYLLIIIICIILSILSSILESFVFTIILKLIKKIILFDK